MNEKIIIEATNPGHILVAYMKDDVMHNLLAESEERVHAVGSIYAGKVLNIVDSLEAYFIDYGSGRNGFLPFSSYPKTLNKDEKVIVQITKNERGGKGARLTGYIQLTGLYTVFMPHGPRAKSPTVPFNRLRNENIGVDYELITDDLEELKAAWEMILLKANDLTTGSLHNNSSIIDHIIRDSYTSDSAIIVNNEYYFTLLSKSIPEERVVLYDESVPIFYKYGVVSDIKALSKDAVRLTGGGHIVINETEAMVTIDVNSGTAGIGLTSLEESSHRVNLQAARESAKQIGLRDLSGTIAIDFITMKTKAYIAAVENEFREAIKKISNTARIGAINEFGVLMMSTKRSRFSMKEYLYEKCEYCDGMVRSAASLANEILWEIQLAIHSYPSVQITVECNSKTASYLLNDLRNVITNLEKLGNKILILAKNNISGFTITPQGFYETTQTIEKASIEEAVQSVSFDIDRHCIQATFPSPYIVSMSPNLILMGRL